MLNTSGSVTTTRAQFLLKDHLGSVNVITDSAGKITDLLAYTLPKIGGPGSVGVSTSYIGYHTHPHGDLMFSNRMNNHSGNFDGGDSSWVATANKPLYVGVQHDGVVKIGVCEPGNCSHVGRKGTSPSRIIQ